MQNKNLQHHNKLLKYLRELRKQQAFRLIRAKPMTSKEVAAIMGVTSVCVNVMFLEMHGTHVEYEHKTTGGRHAHLYHAIANEYEVEYVGPCLREESEEPPELPSHITRPNMDKIIAKYRAEGKEWNPDTGIHRPNNTVSGSNLSMVV